MAWIMPYCGANIGIWNIGVVRIILFVTDGVAINTAVSVEQLIAFLWVYERHADLV